MRHKIILIIMNFILMIAFPSIYLYSEYEKRSNTGGETRSVSSEKDEAAQH